MRSAVWVLVLCSMVGGSASAAEPNSAVWSMKAPAGLRIGDQEKVGAITWEYVGKAQYSVKSSPPSMASRTIEVPGHWLEKDPFSQILGSRRYAGDGTEWIAVDVDLDRLDAALASNPPPSEELEYLASDEPEWIASEKLTFEPNGWHNTTCTANSVSTTYKIHEDTAPDEDWTVQSSLNVWEAPAVWIMTAQSGGVGYCGGVFVDDDQDWVLTAAHCLYDDSNNPIPKEDVTVCSMGNKYSGADCDAGAIQIEIGPNYNPSFWNPGDDYALIQVSVTTSYTPYLFSAASDGYVTDFDMTASAYVRFESVEPTCDTNFDYTGTDAAGIAADNDGNGAREMDTTTGDISAPIGMSTFHMNLDGGPGWSGSPVWYCGDASCATGDDAASVSVWSGWNGAYTTHVGPKSETSVRGPSASSTNHRLTS